MVQTRASHTTHHKRSSTGHRLGVIPSKHAFSERFKIVEGISGSRAVVEVAVHAEVVELDGSVTRVFGDGSGSSGTRSFSERYLTVPSNLGSTVVVHVHSRTSFRRCSGSRRGTRRSGAV